MENEGGYVVMLVTVTLLGHCANSKTSLYNIVCVNTKQRFLGHSEITFVIKAKLCFQCLKYADV